MHNQASPPTIAKNAAAGVLGRFGLVTLLSLALLVPLGLTAFFPPWSKVECKRRQILYWSERTEVYSKSFAGFDFLLSREKWRREQSVPNPSSDTYFDSIEYEISYPILLIEWLVLLGIAIFAYIRLARRIFKSIQQAGEDNTSSNRLSAT